MKNNIFIIILNVFFISTISYGKVNDSIPIVNVLEIKNIPEKTIKKYWLKIGSDAFNNPILTPIIVAKGKENGKVLGLTAAIHGNELNGIPIIQTLFKSIDVSNLKGTIIGVPGLNVISVFNNRRRFSDHEDLNRIFPGKKEGNTSQQMVYQIYNKIIKLFTHHVDMHTASFGRINSMYVRADLTNDTLKKMAELQNPDIILANKGKPSFGSNASQTLRASASSNGIYSITVEYGNPQVYQPEITKRGLKGIQNLLSWLNMIDKPIKNSKSSIICSSSSWIYANEGGFLETTVSLTEEVKKGQLIGILKNPFGDIVEKYFAPHNGIIIGKSTNPVSISGGRIIHLGILKN